MVGAGVASVWVGGGVTTPGEAARVAVRVGTLGVAEAVAELMGVGVPVPAGVGLHATVGEADAAGASAGTPTAAMEDRGVGESATGVSPASSRWAVGRALVSRCLWVSQWRASSRWRSAARWLGHAGAETNDDLMALISHGATYLGRHDPRLPQPARRLGRLVRRLRRRCPDGHRRRRTARTWSLRPESRRCAPRARVAPHKIGAGHRGRRQRTRGACARPRISGASFGKTRQASRSLSSSSARGPGRTPLSGMRVLRQASPCCGISLLRHAANSATMRLCPAVASAPLL